MALRTCSTCSDETWFEVVEEDPAEPDTIVICVDCGTAVVLAVAALGTARAA